jgi:hypothetical protein
MSADPAAVGQPQHPLAQLTTYELRDYRRDLEQAITGLGQHDPAPAARDGLQTRLAAVIAEQDSRARLASHGQA